MDTRPSSAAAPSTATCPDFPTSEPRVRGRWLHVAWHGLLVFVLSCAVLFPAIRTTSFHGDETGWVASGIYYTRLAGAGNLDYTRWQARPLGPWGSLNLNLGKWLLGVPLLLVYPEADYQALYDFDADYEENRRRGLVPPGPLLAVARASSAAFGVICVLLLFLIGTLAYNEWAGLTAAGLALSHHLFVESVTRAMTDSVYVCFLLCFCLALVGFHRAGSNRQRMLAAVACGLATGLACSVKITALPLSVATFALSSLLPLIQGRWKVAPAAISAILALGVSLGTVYVLNPYFWPVVVRPAAPLAAPSVTDASSLAHRRLDFDSVRRFPRLFRQWKSFMEAQRARGQSRWKGNRTVELHTSLLVRHGALPLEILWIPLAVVLVVRRCLKRRPDEDASWWPVLAFFVANYLLLVFFLVNNWNRYYLPTVLAGRLMLGIALVWSIKRVMEHRASVHVPSRRRHSVR